MARLFQWKFLVMLLLPLMSGYLFLMAHNNQSSLPSSLLEWDDSPREQVQFNNVSSLSWSSSSSLPSVQQEQSKTSPGKETIQVLPVSTLQDSNNNNNKSTKTVNHHPQQQQPQKQQAPSSPRNAVPSNNGTTTRAATAASILQPKKAKANVMKQKAAGGWGPGGIRPKPHANKQKDHPEPNNNNINNNNTTQRPGAIVLGMHRSGTSMLTGLLHKSCGYLLGGPLIGAQRSNPKGHFERKDFVFQNDRLILSQNIKWDVNISHFDSQLAFDQMRQGKLNFNAKGWGGKHGLKWMTGTYKHPWLQKDPRMCITLTPWMQLLKNRAKKQQQNHHVSLEPAILFTYRHPLEVAKSLKYRERSKSYFTLGHGFGVWLVYNIRALQNAKGYCMVHSSYDVLMSNPMVEAQRIVDDLTTKCHVLVPPNNRVSQAVVDEFVDPNLRRNQKVEVMSNNNNNNTATRTNATTTTTKTNATTTTTTMMMPKVLQEYNNGTCKVYEIDFGKNIKKGTPKWKREQRLYFLAMKLYCDLESQAAFQDDYDAWPEIPFGF